MSLTEEMEMQSCWERTNLRYWREKSSRHWVIISGGTRLGFVLIGPIIEGWLSRASQLRQGVNWSSQSECEKSILTWTELEYFCVLHHFKWNEITFDIFTRGAIDPLSNMKMLKYYFLKDKLYKKLNIHIKTFLPLIWTIYLRWIISAGQRDCSNITRTRSFHVPPLFLSCGPWVAECSSSHPPAVALITVWYKTLLMLLSFTQVSREGGDTRTKWK